MANPYAPPPPQPPNPYGVPASPPHGNPYASANPYASQHPHVHGPDGASGGFNPYAPPSERADAHYVQTGHQQFELAGRGTRLAAVMLDGILLIGAFAITAVVGLPLGGEVWVATGSLGMLVMIIVEWVLIAQTGQSPGKMWLGIRITKLDGSLPGFFNGVFLRSWVMALISGSVGGLIGLIDWLMILCEDRRCLHDHVASTRVVVAR